MSGRISHKSINNPDNILDVEQGGFDGDDQLTSLGKIAALHISQLGSATKAAVLLSNSKIPDQVVPNVSKFITPTIKGPGSVSFGSSNTYKITNYNNFGSYSLQADKGTVSRSGDTITYIAPNVPGVAGFTINGRNLDITVTSNVTFGTVIISNLTSSDRIDQSLPLTIICSGGEPSIADNIIAVDVSIVKASDSTEVIYKSHTFGDSTVQNNNGIFTISQAITNLLDETDYLVKVRTRYQLSGISSYSTPKTISTKLRVVITTPVIEAPVNNTTNFSISEGYQFTGSAFALTAGTSSFATSDWQISEDVNFSTLYYNITDNSLVVNNKPTLSGPLLGYSKNYYVRTRYKDNKGNYSQWSPIVAITTSATPTIVTPVLENAQHNRALGDIEPWPVVTTSSAFSVSSPEGGTHSHSQIRTSTSSDFSSYTEENWVVATTSFVVNVNRNIPKYAMVRYQSTTGLISAWSNIATLRNE